MKIIKRNKIPVLVNKKWKTSDGGEIEARENENGVISWSFYGKEASAILHMFNQKEAHIQESLHNALRIKILDEVYSD